MKDLADRIFSGVLSCESALIIAPIIASVYNDCPWYLGFALGAGIWTLYGTLVLLLSLLLPKKHRFSILDCATRPLSSFLELIVLRFPASALDTDPPDEQKK